MKICIDTNAYTFFKRAHPPLIHLFESAEELFVPTVMMGELFSGFYIGSKTNDNINALLEFLETPGVSVVDITPAIADRYGQIFKTLKERGTPLPTNDIWIAACAFESGSRLVTYDSHFNKIPGLVTYSPA